MRESGVACRHSFITSPPCYRRSCIDESDSSSFHQNPYAASPLLPPHPSAAAAASSTPPSLESFYGLHSPTAPTWPTPATPPPSSSSSSLSNSSSSADKKPPPPPPLRHHHPHTHQHHQSHSPLNLSKKTALHGEIFILKLYGSKLILV